MLLVSGSSARSPDQKGIETTKVRHLGHWVRSARSPDQKGIETCFRFPYAFVVKSARSPDQKGIETLQARSRSASYSASARSPDQKGIETTQPIFSCPVCVGLQEALIKKGLRHQWQRIEARDDGLQEALIKKGLRLHLACRSVAHCGVCWRLPVGLTKNRSWSGLRGIDTR